MRPLPLLSKGPLTRDRPWLHVLLLGLTLCSTFATFFVQFAQLDWSRAMEAVTFAIALVLILGCHEMGHYLYARKHGVDTTLPFFIPIPLLGVGTLGAVIRIRSPIPTRNALVDIGAAGPLAGLAVAIPVLIIGILQSKLVPLPAIAHDTYPGTQSLLEAPRSLWHFINDTGTESGVVFIFGDSLLVKILRFLLRGPIPAGMDLQESPLMIAGWFGTLMTMLNLIPIGQLDAGHLTYAWFGRHAETIGKVMAAGLLYLALFHSWSWTLWLVITTLLIRFRHPPVIDENEPLSAGRKVICALCFVAFFLCLMPVPLRVVTLP